MSLHIIGRVSPLPSTPPHKHKLFIREQRFITEHMTPHISPGYVTIPKSSCLGSGSVCVWNNESVFRPIKSIVGWCRMTRDAVDSDGMADADVRRPHIARSNSSRSQGPQTLLIFLRIKYLQSSSILVCTMNVHILASLG